MHHCCAIVFVVGLLVLLLVFLALQPGKLKVHHVLEHAEASDFRLSSGNQGVLEYGKLDFLVWSRNPTKATISYWHKRIGVEYRGHNLVVKGFLPYGLVQMPDSVTHLHAPLELTNVALPQKIAAMLRKDLQSGVIPLTIRVQMRATIGKSSWFFEENQLIAADGKCDLMVSLRRDVGEGNSLEWSKCGWTLREARSAGELWAEA